MPSKKERVAAYLPSFIDERFKSFKAERGINGDSQALIAILSEFFAVSHEVAHLSEPEFVSLSKQIEDLTAKVAYLEGELLGELKSSPQGDLKSELLGELQGELFDRLKPDLKSELLSELKSELLNIPVEIPISPDSLPLTTAEQVKRDTSSNSDLPSGLHNESLNIDLNNADQQVDQISLPPSQEVDQKHSNSGEPLIEPEGSPQSSKIEPKPAVESFSWSELKGDLPPMLEDDLAKRFKLTTPKTLGNKRSRTRDNPEDFIKWSIRKDPENKAWLYDSTTRLYHRVTQHSFESEDF
jgi:hypothetical protein